MDVLAEIEGLSLVGATASINCALNPTATIEAAHNAIRVVLTPSQTQNAALGRYPYELYLHTSGGSIHLILMGYIDIVEGVL